MNRQVIYGRAHFDLVDALIDAHDEWASMRGLTAFTSQRSPSGESVLVTGPSNPVHFDAAMRDLCDRADRLNATFGADLRRALGRPAPAFVPRVVTPPVAPRFFRLADAAAVTRKLDTDAMLRQFCALPLWADTFKRVGIPNLRVRWGTKPQKFVSGRCKYGRRSLRDGHPVARASIIVTVNAHSRPADLAETLLHEVVHAAGYQHHRLSFYTTLREASRQAFGATVEEAKQRRIYEYDVKLREVLHEALGAEGKGLPRVRSAVAATRAR